MKKSLVFSVIVLILCFAFTACDLFMDKSSEIGNVKFVASKEGSTKGISTGDGANAVAFADLTHKIKLVCTEGTGYCTLIGATADYVNWPKETVQLGYGKWTAYAEGYKDSIKYYENSTGVSFIVGPQGVSTDEGITWDSSVSITESYCFSGDTKIKANLSLEVKDEEGHVVLFSYPAYEGYQLKWYKTTTASPTALNEVRTISELTETGREFTEWENPGTAISQGLNTYVAAVIVKTSNPDTIYGMVAVSLSGLTAGSTYTIGSGSDDCVQFGKYGVEFIPLEDRGKYSIGKIDSGLNLQTSVWGLGIDDSDSFTIEKLDDDSFVILFPKDLKTYYMSLYGWFPNSGNPFHAYYRDQLNMTEEEFIDALIDGDIELPKANYKQTRKHPSIVNDTSNFEGTVISIQYLYKEDLDGYIRDFETEEAHDFTNEGSQIYLASDGSYFHLLVPEEVTDYIGTLDSELSYNEKMAEYFNTCYQIDILDDSEKVSIPASSVLEILEEFKVPKVQ